MNRPGPSTDPHSRRGFSLIELIGVLAVIAILAAAAVPAVIKQVDFAAWSNENASLSAMKDALVQHILRSSNIPCKANSAAAISSEMGLAPANIATTPRNYNRAFLIDPSGWLGTALASSDWNQGPAGTTVSPTSSRLMIVSQVGGPPLPTIPSTAFSNIWNTAQGAKPSTLAAWTGNGADLVIQRINLDPLFYRVILNPIDTNSFGLFTIENNGTVIQPLTPITSGSLPHSYWFLQGTVLCLYDNNTVPPYLEAKVIVQADCSFVFQNKAWRGLPQ